MLHKLKNIPFSFFSLDVWLFIIWMIPILITPTSAKNPIARLEELFWMYAIASVAGVILLLWKYIPSIIKFVRETSVWNRFSLLAYFLLIVFVCSTALHVAEAVYHYQDLEIHKQGKEKTLTGKVRILYTPDPSQRGGTNYVYELEIKGQKLYWYHKGAFPVDSSKSITVTYLPHTKHIVALSQ